MIFSRSNQEKNVPRNKCTSEGITTRVVKKYSYAPYSDIMNERFIKGDRVVYTDFYF